MPSALKDIKTIFFSTIYQTVLLIYSSRPPTSKIAAQWFGFAYPFERSSHTLLDEFVDAFEHLFIRFLPVQIILPGRRKKNQLHYSIISL